MNTKPVKYRIRHGGYVSEFDQFIDDFMADHPEVGRPAPRLVHLVGSPG